MRTDATWTEILAARPPKPPRLIEEEVAPGRLLFGPGRRQWLALLGTAFGLAGAGATVVSTTHRGALTHANEIYDNPYSVLAGNAIDPPPEMDGPLLYAVLPPGRRRDPTR